MPRPADSPLFATDATYTMDGDAWEGDPVRVDPGPGRLAEGYEPDTLPAEWLNYQLGLLGDYCDFFNDYCADEGVLLPASQQVVRYLTPPVFQPTAPANWSTDGSFWQSGADAALIHCDLTHRLNKNGSIARVRVLVDPGAARSGAARAAISLFRVNYGVSFASPALTFTTEGTAQQASSGHALQWITIDLTGAPEDVGSDGWVLQFQAGQDTPSGHSGDLVYAVAIEQICQTLRND